MCEIVITAGKNKGRQCHEVNRRCRHKKSTCPNCGTVFERDNVMYHHAKICLGVSNQALEIKETNSGPTSLLAHRGKIALVLQRSPQGKNYLRREDTDDMLHLEFSVSLHVSSAKYKSLIGTLGLEGARNYLFQDARSCTINDKTRYLSDK